MGACGVVPSLFPGSHGFTMTPEKAVLVPPRAYKAGWNHNLKFINFLILEWEFFSLLRPIARIGTLRERLLCSSHFICVQLWVYMCIISFKPYDNMTPKYEC